MYPLVTNDRKIPVADAFAAHRRQPAIEKRFEQLESVFELAPVFLKNEDRIEALFFVYFLALLVQALVERELRRGMKRCGLAHLPLYPEERACHAPTAERIFRLFSLPARTTLLEDDHEVQVFDPELSDLQRKVLRLIGAPASAYINRP